MNKIVRSSHRITVILFLGFLLAFLVSCQQGGSSDYLVLESGYNAFKKTHWIDNDRVIFSGYPAGLPKNNDQRGIYIWDTKTGEVAFLSKATGGLCFDSDNKYVHFALGRELLERTDTSVTERIGWGYGSLGAVKQEWNTVVTPRGVDQKKDRLKSLFSKFECKSVERPPELKDHRWWPLKTEHGYLDKGPRLFPDQADPALYYLRKDGKRVKLPVGKESWSIKGYYPHKQAYLLLLNRQGSFIDKNVLNKNLDQPRIKTCLDGYWLFPDGKTEQICTLFNKTWGKAPLPSIPFNTGILVSANRPTGRDRISGAEQYLLTEGHLKKLINGSMAALSISPDGCKIAFTHARDWDDIRQGRQLKMINTCS